MTVCINCGQAMPQTITIDLDELSWRLRAWRQAFGYSLSHVGDEVGCSAQHLSDLELGRRTPSPELLARLMDLYGVNYEYVPARVVMRATEAEK